MFLDFFDFLSNQVPGTKPVFTKLSWLITGLKWEKYVDPTGCQKRKRKEDNKFVHLGIITYTLNVLTFSLVAH